MDVSQEIIHKLEVQGGVRHFKTGLIALGLVCLVAIYNLRAYKNLDSQEAMDTAQLARNLSQGRGFTTDFIRPLSVYLLKKHYQEQHGIPPLGETPDSARLSGNHPDLANAPLYPLVLAGLLKVVPLHYSIPGAVPTPDGPAAAGFSRYGPEVAIALFNQVLLLALAALVFALARRLFDKLVAWLSTLVFLGTELFWDYSVSGLSTILLLVIYTGLVWMLVLLEQEAREPSGPPKRILLLALLVGGLTGLGALTHYSFGWLIIPVVVFLVLYGGERRIVLSAMAAGVFLLMLTTWLVRNYLVSGTLLGTAGYTFLNGLFPGVNLDRFLNPDTVPITIQAIGRACWGKLWGGLLQVLQSDLPRLAGGWVGAFFLVGLLVNFRSLTIKRLRIFLLMSLLVLSVAQALGRTRISEISPELNSENLLVLLAPVLLIYGVSLFQALLDQFEFPARELRTIALAVFVALASLPLGLTLLHRGGASAPPRYHYDPPSFQKAAAMIKEKELTMSNVPWAMAWYGHRQCIWCSMNCLPKPGVTEPGESILAVNDYLKPLSLVYLTPETIQGNELARTIGLGVQSWDYFQILAIGNAMPSSFPLHHVAPGFLPREVVLTDWERWKAPATR